MTVPRGGIKRIDVGIEGTATSADGTVRPAPHLFAVTGDPWLAEVAPITGPMYQLYICFMITDPKTTTRHKWSQCVVAFLIAVAEMILRLNQVVYAPFYALFVVGPAANLIEIWWDSRHPKARPVQPSAAVATMPQGLTVSAPCSENGHRCLTTDGEKCT